MNADHPRLDALADHRACQDLPAMVPDADHVAIGNTAGDSCFELVIPLDACSRYGIVRVQCDTRRVSSAC